MINQKNQPPQLSEGESNSSKRRAEWQENTHNAETRKVLEQDSSFFINQAVSSPCLSVVKKAEGACIEDTNGRIYLDFHGNNVHHIGYGHPDLKKAISLQMDALPFAPRRFACDSALELAKKLVEISPGNLSKVLFTAGGSDAIEVALKIARAATGRHKTHSGIHFMEPASGQHLLAGNSFSAHMFQVRCFQEQNMLLLLHATVVHTVILILMVNLKLKSAILPVLISCAMFWKRKEMLQQ